MIFGASRSRRPRSTVRGSRRTADELEPVEDLPPKLVPSVRQLFNTAIALAHTRLSLAGLELEEEMQRLIRVAAFGFVSLVLVFLALIVATFTIVAAVPPEYRVLTMIIIAVAYLAIALVLVLQIKKIFTDRPPIFGATLAELQKDKETLSQMVRAHEAAEQERERAQEARRQQEEDAFANARAARTAARGAR